MPQFVDQDAKSGGQDDSDKELNSDRFQLWIADVEKADGDCEHHKAGFDPDWDVKQRETHRTCLRYRRRDALTERRGARAQPLGCSSSVMKVLLRLGE